MAKSIEIYAPIYPARNETFRVKVPQVGKFGGEVNGTLYDVHVKACVRGTSICSHVVRSGNDQKDIRKSIAAVQKRLRRHVTHKR